jgi:hypothetical protein
VSPHGERDTAGRDEGDAHNDHAAPAPTASPGDARENRIQPDRPDTLRGDAAMQYTTELCAQLVEI